MGQTGSSQLNQIQRRQYYTSSTLPQEPLRLAPKVLPELSPTRLRRTDNGVILQSGGTISGRRPLSATLPEASEQLTKHVNGHIGVYRSRSASSGEVQSSDGPSSRHSRYLRERDPLHRSQTQLDFHKETDISRPQKKFGSEPDLRHEEEKSKPKHPKHFRKKYKAPPPPAQRNSRDGSSPDSYDRCPRVLPTRKLRLFKTRTETKNQNHEPSNISSEKYNGSVEIKLKKPQKQSQNQCLERRYKSPCKDKDSFIKYPDSQDMVQTTASLKREGNIFQSNCRRSDNRKNNLDKSNAYRSKAGKCAEQLNENKTPNLDRTFRYSERFRKEESLPVLRRERSFDATLMKEYNEHEERKRIIAEQLRSRLNTPHVSDNRPVRKSLPSLLSENNAKDQFQAELKKATTKIKNEIVKSRTNQLGKNEQTSQSEKNSIIQSTKCKNNYLMNRSKLSSPCESKTVKEVSESNVAKINRERSNLLKAKHDVSMKEISKKITESVNSIDDVKRESRLADRGQASGKESTPERSPVRMTDRRDEMNFLKKERVPSKQFYFGMIESKDSNINEKKREFPGLGSPITDFTDFNLIEQKLLGYHEEDKEINSFDKKIRPEEEKVPKQVSSESALSSETEIEDQVSDGSKDIDLHLRPTLPKKQLEIPRFSPAAAWRQLAQLEAELEALAVDTKMENVQLLAAESPARSDDKSGDKSGDSGISGDHGHIDQRLDSPPRRQIGLSNPVTWTPQQDLEGDSSSDTAGEHSPRLTQGESLVTYSARGQPFSLSLPRENQQQDKAKQFQQPFNSLQKLKKSVSGALGAALGSRKFDLENEPIFDDPCDQNWFLSKSAPNSLRDPFIFTNEKDDQENENDSSPLEEQKDPWTSSGPASAVGQVSYMSWGGHVMYLPPAPALTSLQPQSMCQRETVRQPNSLINIDRPIRSKSSGEIELRSRGEARGVGALALGAEMRERERSASPAALARAIPALAMYTSERTSKAKAKRFTFQSTVRQLERKRLAEKLSREADLKEQQRKTEQEAMRRVEEEFQRKRAREKANIRQQLRLVSGNSNYSPVANNNNNHIVSKPARDEPDGAVSSRSSPAMDRLTARIKSSTLEEKVGDSPRRRHHADENRKASSNTSSEISAPHSGISKSTTPVRCVVLSEWRESGSGSRQYRDWGTSHNIDHPPACYRMPKSPLYLNANGTDCIDGVFTGSPRSDNYRLEFARGAARTPPRTPQRTPPRTPAPFAPRSPHSSSGSELSSRRAQRLRDSKGGMSTPEVTPETDIVPQIIRPNRPSIRLVAN